MVAAARGAAAAGAAVVLCCLGLTDAWRLPSSALPATTTTLAARARGSGLRSQPRRAAAATRGWPLKMMSDAPLPPTPELLATEAVMPPFRPDLGVGRDAVLTKVLALNGGEDFVKVNIGELALSAVRKMNEKNADCCLIFDEAGKLAGIFTERVRARGFGGRVWVMCYKPPTIFTIGGLASSIPSPSQNPHKHRITSARSWRRSARRPRRPSARS